MQSFPKVVRKLISELTKLPSIGEKSAARLAYHIVTNLELADSFSKVLQEVKTSVCFCKKCYFLSDSEFCAICKDESRNSELLCIVEKPMDIIAFEKMGDFRGFYHVLNGVWAPIRGQGTENLKLDELIVRIKEENIREVILATSSTVEGDATAMYISQLLSEIPNVVTSRLAQGVPKGGELEYMDEVTLSRALQGRASI